MSTETRAEAVDTVVSGAATTGQPTSERPVGGTRFRNVGAGVPGSTGPGSAAGGPSRKTEVAANLGGQPNVMRKFAVTEVKEVEKKESDYNFEEPVLENVISDTKVKEDLAKYKGGTYTNEAGETVKFPTVTLDTEAAEDGAKLVKAGENYPTDKLGEGENSITSKIVDTVVPEANKWYGKEDEAAKAAAKASPKTSILESLLATEAGRISKALHIEALDGALTDTSAGENSLCVYLEPTTHYDHHELAQRIGYGRLVVLPARIVVGLLDAGVRVFEAIQGKEIVIKEANRVENTFTLALLEVLVKAEEATREQKATDAKDAAKKVIEDIMTAHTEGIKEDKKKVTVNDKLDALYARLSNTRFLAHDIVEYGNIHNDVKGAEGLSTKFDELTKAIRDAIKEVKG